MKLVTAAVSSCFASATALANPTGMAVQNGTVTTDTTIPNQLVITNSPNSILNWQSFSIGAGELTRFNQQSPASAVLNRVVTNNPSEIFGALQSNGRVFLINPNGIVFEPGSSIDVAGLVASSLNLSNEDFIAGTMHFEGVAGAGSVTNKGNIFAHPGGQVYLVGPAVTNEGVIFGPQGEVVLAAGNSVDLVSPGTPGLSVTVTATGNQARNLGQIFADSGRVGIFAGLIDQRGYIQANTAVAGEDGTIRFQATGTTTLAAGSQMNSTGALNIDAGELVVNGRAYSGPQTIRADSILLQGGSSGSGQLATLTANSGSQDIRAGAGGLTMIGGSGGGGNYVIIQQASADPLATQTIHSDGQLWVQGGEGNTNFALIRGYGGQQTVEAGNTTLLAGAGGVDNFVSIQAPVEDMRVHGNLTLTARGSTRNVYGGGVKIGGLGGAGSPTQLALQVEGDLTMTAGSAAGAGTVIGSTVGGALPNNISITANGDVTLNGGTAHNAWARIGALPSSDAGGNIAVSAPSGTIALNSTAPDAYALIRTADSVTLNAQQITEGPDSRIEAGSLAVQTSSGASLTGANAVGAFNASNGPIGDIALNNTSAVLTASNVFNPSGALTLRQAGDLLVNGTVISGPQTIDVTGGLVVQNDLVGNAYLSASGGQTINAGYIEVNAGVGGSVSIFNFGGDQHIVTTSKNAAGEGLAIRAVDGAYAAIDSPSGSQTIEVHNADEVVVEGLSGFAAISNLNSVQSLSVTGPGANALVLGSSDALGQSIIGGGSTQSIVAGNPGEQGSITLYGPGEIASSSDFGTTQSVATSGALNVIGRSVPGNVSAGIFAHGFGGQQMIKADSIVVQGGSIGGSNSSLIFANSNSQIVEAGAGGITLIGGTEGPFNSALITSNGISQTIDAATSGITLIGGASGTSNSAQIAANGGSQTIEAGAAGITLTGGADGSRNFAMINQASSNPVETQTVHSTGDVLLQGGEGNFNFAMIRGFGGQQSFEVGNTTLLAGAGGIDNFAAIQGRNQDMTVHGNLALTARGSGRGTAGGGVRIGGVGGGSPSATQLTLHVDGNLTMMAGSVPGTGAVLGSDTRSTQPNDVTIVTGGDVTLDGGTAPNTYSLIGAAASSDAGGDVAVTAGGTISLNSTAPNARGVIRTADGVSLNAQRITEGPDARIQAGNLAVQTSSGALLTGANAVDALSATNLMTGDFAFSNTSPLLSVVHATNINGAMSLRQTGDLLVNGDVSSGPQTIDVTGGLTVQNEPFSFAQIGASGGQSINAGYVEVNAGIGGSASIFNFGGDQLISTFGSNAAGEGLAVRGTDFGFASISANSGSQFIDVRNADRAVVDAGSGFANIINIDGAQTVSVAGSGENALVLGSPGALAQSVIGGGSYQTVVAGNPGEQGSITLYGTDSGSFGNTLIVSNPVPGGTQAVSTSGALTVIAGSAPNSSPAGVFANGIGGQQTIHAESILLQGGANGSSNSAMIGANNGSQTIDVGAGGITLIGGAAGFRNFAMINQALSDPAEMQSVHSTGDVLLQSGEGNFNFAMIRGFGGQQTFEAGNTTLLAGAGGTDNFASIQGRTQDMTVHGDLALTGRGAVGTPAAGGGSRIGGVGGGSPSATQLSLQVDGNLTMTAGSVEGTGTLLGSAPASTMPNDISVLVGHDVTLNGGTAPNTYSRIGAVAASDAGGMIDIAAPNGTIALNSSAPSAGSVIRTADGVTLTAQQVTEGSDSRIEAGSLTVQTSMGASLPGANAVSAFNAMNSAFGDIAFHNTSSLLTVTGIHQVDSGALSLDQAGDLLIAGNVRSGTQRIDASGGFTIAAGSGPGLTVRAHGAQSFSAGGNFSLLGGSGWNSYAQATADGPMQIRAGHDLLLQGGSGLLAYSLLDGRNDIRLTVGNELRLNHGAGWLAFARVQTGFWGRIFLDFPDRTGGGYFVDGREGATYWGLDGFFTGLRPARPGRSLLVSYGG